MQVKFEKVLFWLLNLVWFMTFLLLIIPSGMKILWSVESSDPLMENFLVYWIVGIDGINFWGAKYEYWLVIAGLYAVALVTSLACRCRVAILLVFNMFICIVCPMASKLFGPLMIEAMREVRFYGDAFGAYLWMCLCGIFIITAHLVFLILLMPASLLIEKKDKELVPLAENELKAKEES